MSHVITLKQGKDTLYLAADQNDHQKCQFKGMEFKSGRWKLPAGTIRDPTLETANERLLHAHYQFVMAGARIDLSRFKVLEIRDGCSANISR